MKRDESRASDVVSLSLSHCTLTVLFVLFFSICALLILTLKGVNKTKQNEKHLDASLRHSTKQHQHPTSTNVSLVASPPSHIHITKYSRTDTNIDNLLPTTYYILHLHFIITSN